MTVVAKSRPPSAFGSRTVTTGAGSIVRVTERWSAEFTYQYGYGEPRQITGNRPAFPSGASADGKLTYRAHGFSAGFRWLW